MQRHRERIRALGATLVAVAQGTGEEAARFCRQLEADCACLGDPGKACYRLFSLPRDSWWKVTGAPFFADPKLALRRIRHASLRGSLMRHSDVLQLGGVVVIDGGGTIRYLYRSSRTDDYPPTSEIVAKLERLVAERGRGETT